MENADGGEMHLGQRWVDSEIEGLQQRQSGEGERELVVISRDRYCEPRISDGDDFQAADCTPNHHLR